MWKLWHWLLGREYVTLHCNLRYNHEWEGHIRRVYTDDKGDKYIHVYKTLPDRQYIFDMSDTRAYWSVNWLTPKPPLF